MNDGWNPYQLEAERDKTLKWLNDLAINDRQKSYLRKMIKSNNDVNWLSGIRQNQAVDIDSWLSATM